MDIKKAQTWMMDNCPLPKAIRWVKNHFKNLNNKEK
jgi:hypothetical protein